MAGNTMQELVGEIKDFISWVKDTLEDDVVRKSLLEDIGLDTTDPPPKPNLPQDKLDSIGRYQQTVDADRQALLTALSDLRAVFDSLRAYIASFNLSLAQVGEVTKLFLNLLALNYIRLRQPRVFFIAQLIGFIEDTASPHASGKVSWDRFVDLVREGTSYVVKRVWGGVETEEKAQARSDFYFTALAAAAVFVFKENNTALYSWDAAPQSITTVADSISRRMLSTAFFSRETDPTTGKIIEKQIKASFYFLTSQQGGPGLYLALGGSGELETPLNEKWKVIFKVSSGAAVDMMIGEGGFTIHGPTGDKPDIRASLAVQSIPDDTNRSFVLPSNSDTHVEIGNIAFVAVLNSAEAEIKLALNECALVIATKDNDGFLASLLPSDGLRLPFNFGIGLGNKRGLFTEGNIPFISGRSIGGSQPSSPRAMAVARSSPPATSAPGSQDGTPVPVAGSVGNGFSVPITIGKALGPVELYYLQLKLTGNPATTDPSDVTAEASLALSLKLGPAFLSIDRLGFEFKVAFPDSGGNLGFANLSLGPALPRGIGLTIDSPAVTGGGFLYLDQERGQYAGVAQLNLEGGIAVKAITLIATRLPDGAKGFSLLVIITVENFQPIQLGLGFKLTGIGGLLAINRTFNQDVLREGIKNHTLDNVLFPPNPTRDALQLLSALNRVFPVAKGHHLFGPMVKIEWGTPTIITMRLGVVLEVGARLRLIVMGQVSAIMPSEKNDLIRLHMDTLGILDFDQRSLSLDAVLYDSRLLQKFTLTGSMAMRLSWRSSPTFALSIAAFIRRSSPRPISRRWSASPSA